MPLQEELDLRICESICMEDYTDTYSEGMGCLSGNGGRVFMGVEVVHRPELLGLA